MKCTIPGKDVKVFARAVLALSKIGEELHMEFLAQELMIRAVSPAKSAYASFTFRPDFFTDFRNDGAMRQKKFAHKDVHNRFRFYMKALLPIFKTNNIEEKNLESLEIAVDFEEHKMHFSFVKRHRVVHKHSITLSETSLLQTAYSKKDTKSCVTASPHLLTEIIGNFPQSVLEITLTFQEQQFSVTNYTAEAPDPKQASQMQLLMDMNEFDHYEIEHPTAVTCTLRELKGVAYFLTSDMGGFGLPVNLFFTKPGVPLLVSIDSPGQYEAVFVIATIESATATGLLTQSQGSLAASANHQSPAADTGKGESTTSRHPANNTNGQQEFESPLQDTLDQKSQPPGSFCKVPGASAAATKRLIGFDSRILTQRPSQLVAKDFLVGDTDDEDGSDGSDRERGF